MLNSIKIISEDGIIFTGCNYFSGPVWVFIKCFDKKG